MTINQTTASIPEHWLAALTIAHRVVTTLVSHHDPAVRQAAQALADAFAQDQYLPCDEQTRWQHLSAPHPTSPRANNKGSGAPRIPRSSP